MNDVCEYQIEIRGPAAAADLNAAAPQHITVLHTSPCTSLLAACTDQSGLIGLLRHLHGLGFELLLVRKCA